MQNFGRFVDDIRKLYPDIVVNFLIVNGRDTMTITTHLLPRKVVIDTKNTGDIIYDTPEYEEHLAMVTFMLGTINVDAENK